MNKLVLINHKSELTLQEVKEYLLNINELIRNDLDIVIFPSNIYIPYFIGKYKFKTGSQSISSVSINGEITGKQLKSSGVTYSIIGHHERKDNLNETSKKINNQIKEAIKHSITPVVILGETYYQNEMKKTLEVINKQIKEYFECVEVKEDIILVYEPNWEYKGKQIPTKGYIIEVVDLIKNIIKRKYNINIKVLYGGHITPENISKIDSIPNIDGFLIGKSSIDLDKLKQIFEIIE